MLGPLAISAAACPLSVSKDQPVGAKNASSVCNERNGVVLSELCLLIRASCLFTGMVAGRVAAGLLVCKVHFLRPLVCVVACGPVCTDVSCPDVLSCECALWRALSVSQESIVCLLHRLHLQHLFTQAVDRPLAYGVRRMHSETTITETCHHGPLWYCPVLLPASAGLFASLFRGPAHADGSAC